MRSVSFLEVLIFNKIIWDVMIYMYATLGLVHVFYFIWLCTVSCTCTCTVCVYTFTTRTRYLLYTMLHTHMYITKGQALWHTVLCITHLLIKSLSTSLLQKFPLNLSTLTPRLKNSQNGLHCQYCMVFILTTGLFPVCVGFMSICLYYC